MRAVARRGALGSRSGARVPGRRPGAWSWGGGQGRAGGLLGGGAGEDAAGAGAAPGGLGAGRGRHGPRAPPARAVPFRGLGHLRPACHRR